MVFQISRSNTKTNFIKNQCHLGKETTMGIMTIVTTKLADETLFAWMAHVL